MTLLIPSRKVPDFQGNFVNLYQRAKKKGRFLQIDTPKEQKGSTTKQLKSSLNCFGSQRA